MFSIDKFSPTLPSSLCSPPSFFTAEIIGVTGEAKRQSGIHCTFNPSLPKHLQCGSEDGLHFGDRKMDDERAWIDFPE